MLKNFVVTMILLSALLVSGCSGGQKVEQRSLSDTSSADMSHTARNALDWSGSNYGQVPSPSCPGIETTMSLNADNTYLLREKYRDESDSLFVEQGRFRWVDGTRIELDEQADNRMFFVGENVLFMLDKDGNKIKGKLASHYMLHKE
ncbi:copper resistance protein NlpE [Oleidesulfovibrio sp.]|uniref:copper resistance protein NlpE n=1 Tax=Oleidesulfovibrio sp. TaxID=2909707 RepID=UPI003A848AB9